METHVESVLADMKAAQSGIRVRMLGPLSDQPRRKRRRSCPPRARCGRCLPISPSLRIRSGAAALRASWDVPNDPRGELRWCLEQAQKHPRRTRSPAGRHLGRHGFARPRRLPCRRRRGCGRSAAGNRQARLQPAGGVGRAVCRRLPGWAGARPQSAVRRLAHCTEAPLRRVPRRAARTAGGTPSSRIGRGASAPGEMGRARLVRCTRAHDAARRAGRARTARRVRATSCHDGTALRSRGTGLRARSRSVAALKARRTAAPRSSRFPPSPPATGRRFPARHHCVTSCSLAVMPFVEAQKDGGCAAAWPMASPATSITRLAKLRNLFVIARGSVFALAERDIGRRRPAGG